MAFTCQMMDSKVYGMKPFKAQDRIQETQDQQDKTDWPTGDAK
jgi:hypothetical protein